MPRLRRLSVFALILTTLLVLGLPVLAQTTETTTADTTATTVASGPAPEPAVPAAQPAADTGPDDWTYRYLIPTLLVLAALIVIVTTVQYFMQVVRKRYKVVE
jgi:phosphatidylglycerophosphate synthase